MLDVLRNGARSDQGSGFVATGESRIEPKSENQSNELHNFG